MSAMDGQRLVLTPEPFQCTRERAFSLAGHSVEAVDDKLERIRSKMLEQRKDTQEFLESAFTPIRRNITVRLPPISPGCSGSAEEEVRYLDSLQENDCEIQSTRDLPATPPHMHPEVDQVEFFNRGYDAHMFACRTDPDRIYDPVRQLRLARIAPPTLVECPPTDSRAPSREAGLSKEKILKLIREGGCSRWFTTDDCDKCKTQEIVCSKIRDDCRQPARYVPTEGVVFEGLEACLPVICTRLRPRLIRRPDTRANDNLAAMRARINHNYWFSLEACARKSCIQ